MFFYSVPVASYAKIWMLENKEMCKFNMQKNKPSRFLTLKE